MSQKQQFFPDRAPIDAYGNGGFRFAEMSHRGSLLILPSGMYAWPIRILTDLSANSLERVVAEKDSIDFLLLGTGVAQNRPAAAVAAVLENADIGLEVMDTGAACRTYNVLLGERRAVAAALIAVE